MTNADTHKPMELIEKHAENRGWEIMNHSDTGLKDIEYRHPTGGRFQLYFDDEERRVFGGVYRGPEPEENFITSESDHSYLSEPYTELDEDLLKEIVVPTDHQPEELEELVNNITEIFTTPDYNLPEITR